YRWERDAAERLRQHDLDVLRRADRFPAFGHVQPDRQEPREPASREVGQGGRATVRERGRRSRRWGGVNVPMPVPFFMISQPIAQTVRTSNRRILRDASASAVPTHEGRFAHLARAAATLSGKPVAFFTATGVVLLWAILGPVFHYSDTWQLVINTGTTIVTFLM